MQTPPLPSPWKPLRWPALLTVLVLAYGVAGYMLIEDWSFVDALYMTLLALTTVGFKEVHPLDTSGRLFTISVLILGVSLVLLTLSLAARAVAEGGLGSSRRRRMQKRIEALENHFIVCAYGRVGRAIAREFEAEGVPYVVIDRDEEKEEELIQDGALYILGDATEEALLKSAGLERARGLVSAVDSDAENIFITLVARSLNPDIYIVARASEANAAERLYRAGANRVVSPFITSGRHMAHVALRPRVVDFIELASHQTPSMRLEELQVEKGSNLVGKTLADVRGATTPLAVQRADGRVIPNPAEDLELQEGDLLVLLGAREALRPLEER